MIGKETKTHLFGEPLMVNGNKVVIFRNPNIDLNSYSSKNFYISHKSPASLANEYLGAVKIAQSNDQSTILILSFVTENRDLGVDFLNALMQVYDSLNIENKNRISVNSLNFINENLDTLVVQIEQPGRTGKELPGKQ